MLAIALNNTLSANVCPAIVAHYFLNHGTEQQKRRYLLRMPGVVLVVCETDPSQAHAASRA